MGAEATAMRTVLILYWAALSLAYGSIRKPKKPSARLFRRPRAWKWTMCNGYIHVTGYNGSEIQMVAEKTIEAESAERLDAAKREVKLDVSQIRRYADSFMWMGRFAAIATTAARAFMTTATADTA